MPTAFPSVIEHCPALGVLVQCRAGFEADAALELQKRADAARILGSTSPEKGYCLLDLATPQPRDQLQRRLDASQLVFSRQSFQFFARLDALPERDRLNPLVAAVIAGGERFSTVLLETPDTNDAKEISAFLRRFAPLFDEAMRGAGLLCPDSPHLPRLHVFFVGATRVFVGLSSPSDGSAWPMGIPRLAMPKDAPSRSTLKLAEAILTLLSPDEQRTTLQPGLQAVDLGAAPGGWSWQLAARHGMRVTALDNGPLAPAVLATGRVEHLRADGFTWRPKKPVAWMVCDMVEQPSRIAALMAEWVASGLCRHSIFNLKLPMKRRHEEVERCRALIALRFHQAGSKYILRIKHLYHDREEVSCYLTRR
jgi:23S rRNA (cytidine2498-2'-O)-methyltransferase